MTGSHHLARAIASGAAIALVLALGTATRVQAQLPLEPMKTSGQSITAAYEGWFKNEDGSYSLLVGYFNRNAKESIDIPVGPDNAIEPGGPDYGQPTHFLPRRQWGVFTIHVPADFPGKSLTWTIVAHGQKTEIPMALKPLWEVSPYRNNAEGNTPPVLRFSPEGPELTGPPLGIAQSLKGKVNEPVTLAVWAADDRVVDAYERDRPGPPVDLTWSKFRGPGEVQFESTTPEVSETDGSSSTTATFSQPGDYILRLQANDVSGDGGGGAQCCWTNVHVAVSVSGGT